ncbi:hypothetical protein Pint_27780 [Pistacia integerrima]|uniref:Uncharacterized protein n=1 Tax=Pistacia integerrima TaxID=434235 RepID=A0ACC0YTJ2_9ROSI|nr:hypothetical protein Pint_27780 [Pistacia integerrima]
MLRLHRILLKKLDSILENSTNDRWKWFKNCLGALDGAYIWVHVDSIDKPRYRTRKNEIATNVLGVCTLDMQFIYVLPGWEGSATDGRVLRAAINRRHGLKVPQGFYYLCDAGYTNGEGFLAPFRGQQYHLNEWRQGRQLVTLQEYSNMKHSQARNKRWGILRETSFNSVRTQCRIISACCLLHNFIRNDLSRDPIESEVGEVCNVEDEEEDSGEVIRHVETSAVYTAWRDNLAQEMFNSWMSSRNT